MKGPNGGIQTVANRKDRGHRGRWLRTSSWALQIMVSLFLAVRELRGRYLLLNGYDTRLGRGSFSPPSARSQVPRPRSHADNVGQVFRHSKSGALIADARQVRFSCVRSQAKGCDIALLFAWFASSRRAAQGLVAVLPPMEFRDPADHYAWLLEQGRRGTQHTNDTIPQWSGLGKPTANNNNDISLRNTLTTNRLDRARYGCSGVITLPYKRRSGDGGNRPKRRASSITIA